MKLVVTIPALNEAATIERVISQIPRQISEVTTIEVLVIDDASTDGTPGIARAAGAQVVTLRGRHGLGRNFRTAMRLALEADADLIVNIDGDGQFDAAQVPTLIAPLLAARADVVTCVRFHPGAPRRRDMTFAKWLGNHGVTWLVNRTTGLALADVSCGFRAYTRDAAAQLQQFARGSYVEECVLDLAHRDLRFEQIWLPVRGTREHGESRLAASVLKYGFHFSQTFLRTLRDQRPMRLFGGLSAVSFAIAVLAAIGIGWQLALLPCVVATLLLLAALIGDGIARHRAVDEDLLYLVRRQRNQSVEFAALLDPTTEAAAALAIPAVSASVACTTDITASTSTASMQ